MVKVRGLDRLREGDEATRIREFRIESPGRRIRMPQLLVGVLVIAVAGLAMLVVYSRASARTPVLALTATMERGQVASADHFQVVYLAADEPVAHMSSPELANLVGRVAAADLEAGTLAAPGLFVERDRILDGEGVVGLALAPGQYPTSRLAIGDLVDVVATGESGRVLVSQAVVHDISDLGAQDSKFVSVRVPSDLATELAQAAAADQITLTLTGGG